MSRLDIRWQGTTVVDGIRLVRRGWGFRMWEVACSTKRSTSGGTITSSIGIGGNEYYYQLSAGLNGLYVMYGPWPYPWNYEEGGAPDTCIQLPLPKWGPGWSVLGERLGRYDHTVVAVREGWWHWFRFTVWWRFRLYLKYKMRRKS